ncbi:uncharacterized protein LOC108103535 [Drosophila eugracilis]|uniref:uncharacterized protein LOC108103535 n=1 Tax=Drosophila eugracilis TaxID=29029 RepID=UPI0007E84510|nr:uncharacterized protein LOC108103535 [Drosophila eugracilis]
MEDMHLKLGDLSQQTLAARHSLILGQKLGGALRGPQQQAQHHHHHLNHQLNQLSQLNQLNQLNHLNQLTQLRQHLQNQLSLNLNLGFGPKPHNLTRPMHMGRGLCFGGLDLDLDLGGNLESSSSSSSNSTSSSSSCNSTSSNTSHTSTNSNLGQGHGSGTGLAGSTGIQGEVEYVHEPGQEDGDSLNVKGRCSLETASNTDEGDSHLEAKQQTSSTKDEKDKDLLVTIKPSPSVMLKAANSNLNADATVYTMPDKVETHYNDEILPKPEFRLNAEAAVFTPSMLGLGSLLQAVELPLHPAVSQPLLPTPHLPNYDFPAQNQQPPEQLFTNSMMKQNVRWRKQPLPDLFIAVISLIRELSRSVSYPEIINTLAIRLQRPEVELKRHVPHTLHSAVNNGFLKKEGNRYSLVSDMEQVEIMKRNQEAAKRAKELEKEPLSWRKR